jgi:hypothetical protein
MRGSGSPEERAGQAEAEPGFYRRTSQKENHTRGGGDFRPGWVWWERAEPARADDGVDLFRSAAR